MRDCVVKWKHMEWLLTIAVALCAVVSANAVANTSAEHLQVQQLIRDELSHGKRNLAQNLLRTELRDRDSVQIKSFQWKLGMIQGSAASTFRSFNQSFVLAGRLLHRLKSGSEPSSFAIEPVAKFQDFLPNVAFIESVEWEGLLYLLAAYEQGYLQLFTVASDNQVILRQSIQCYGVPTDAEFFMQEDKLFLVVAAQNGSSQVPLVVYHWDGTHLDEKDRNLLIEASVVSTFPFRESIIIVVGVGASSNQKAGLAVLRRTGSRLEMVQFIVTDGPMALQHFTFKSENYIFVTKTGDTSVIFWWAGTEMIEWDVLKSGESVRSVGVGYIHGETFIVLSEKTKIIIYRPTAAALQLIDSHNFGSAVQSASIYTHNDSIMMLAITESAGTLTPYLLDLQLHFQPAFVDHRSLVRDPLLQCISKLEADLKQRKAMLQDVVSQRKQLLQRNSPGVFRGKLVVKKLVQKNANIRSLKLKADESRFMPKLTAQELRKQIFQATESIRSLTQSAKNVVFKSLPSSLSGRLVTDHFQVENANMDSVIINRLNGHSFDPNNILMYSKDQTFSGAISGDAIAADAIVVGSLNSIKIDDLLLRRGHQVVLGLDQVTNVKATNVRIKSHGTINGISLNRIVTSKAPGTISVSGTKTFAALDLQQLAVDLLNNVNFTKWISSLQPQRPVLPVLPPVVTKNFNANGDLSIQNLTVRGNINGVPFDDLLSSLFLRGINQNILGDLTYTSKLTVTNLTASIVNGVPTRSFLTRTTNQVIAGSLSLESLSAPELIADRVNGLNIRQDVAFVNSAASVSTPVVFQRLQAHELVLPPLSSISGQPIGRRLLNQPKIIYQGNVKVKGSLKLADFKLKRSIVRLNGQIIDFSNLHHQYWTKSSSQVFQNRIQTNSGLNVKSLRIGSINGFLMEDFVDVSSTKVLRGNWYFPSANILGNLIHEPHAEQSPLSPKTLSSSIVKTTGDFTVSGSKIFLGGLTTKHLVSEYLDSKKISDIFGKEFEGGSAYEEVFVGGDLIVQSDLIVGSVNNIKLCDRLSKALLIDQKGHIPSAAISAVSASNIDVKTFNGVPFSVIGGERNKPMTRVRKVTIKGDISVPAFVNVMSVNNKAVTQEYLSRVVDRMQSGVIRGKKTFASELVVEKNLYAYEYNGENLKNLFENVLSKTKDQIIYVPISMKEMITGELKATVINDIPVSNLLSSDFMSRQTIEGDLIFTNELDVLGTLFATTYEDGCNLSVVNERLQALDGRHWASLTVEGNLNWTSRLPERIPGLTYYLGSAVTKNTVQIIVSEVVFDSPVSVNNFFSRMDINDVDISGLLADSLKKSLPDQVVLATKIFTNKLHSTSMRVNGNVVAKTIAGVNISLFNSSLVRVSGDQNVRGRKRFLQGFSADLLRVDGTVNGLVTSYIANYDLPLLPPIHFIGPLEIAGDLNFERVNDFSLNELLQERVTLDSSQQLQGHITFTRDLTINGDLVCPSINRVDTAQIVERECLSEQVIAGTKHFVQGLKVDGPVEVDSFDGVQLRNAYNAALFRDQNATIFGNFILRNVVTMRGDLNVDTTVNSVQMDVLARRLRNVTPRSLAHVRNIARTINDTNELLKARGDLSELLYLERVLEAPMSISQTHRATAVSVGGDETYINVYGFDSNKACGLPKSCECPAQYSLYVGSEGLGHATWSSGLQNNASERSFTFHLEKSKVAIVVKTNTVSWSSRCRLDSEIHLNEMSLITWVDLDSNKTSNNVLGEISFSIEPSPILGYLSDVKPISVQNRVYLVLGISYNADLDTRNVNSVIVRLDKASRRAMVVEEFPTYGVSVLDVLYTTAGPHIIVGNTFDSLKSTSQVNLNIYRFNIQTEKLIPIKNIPADSVVAVASVVQSGDSLIVIAQKQEYAPVIVLKYDSAHDDYNFMQQLNPNTIPTGLGVFYVGQQDQSDAFLGVSTSDDQFFLYKFCHIEGFKLVMKMELQGVHGFTTFSHGHRQYIFFTSSDATSIFEIVKQSS